MAMQATPMKKRGHYSDSYREDALSLADHVDVTAAARELGLQPRQLYQWRAKVQQIKSSYEHEKSLADESARLKRQLAERKAVYFAKNLK